MQKVKGVYMYYVEAFQEGHRVHVHLSQEYLVKVSVKQSETRLGIHIDWSKYKTVNLQNEC